MLYIDLDGVLANFNKQVSLEIWKLVSGQTPVGESKSTPRKIKKYRKLNGWEYIEHTEESLRRKEVKSLLYAVAGKPGFFSGLEVLENNNLIDSIIEQGVEFEFLTAGIGQHSVQEKKDWCREVLGRDEACNVVLSDGTKSTAELKAEFCKSSDDILIDDNKKNVEAWIQARGTAIHWTGAHCLGSVLGLLSF